ncbi:TSUP family transporter [Marinomonas mediterranea]|uniref:TSUP family transporter n=1 Tax=Marinomonas mediterranea TaxID=119864 RepID=UPI00234A36E1|nr:TSUP family transporter [Marinomonas mediterranea]WCN07954.1 TSUP family transporter [Marinomonas mediterranea]
MEGLFAEWSIWLYLGLFLTAFLAGIVDTIAGGGGLITVPVLLAAGLSPAEALATNKLQGCAGTLSASYHFIKTRQVAINTMWFAITMTAIGSIAGTLLVSYLDSGVLIKLIPIILIAVAAFFYWLPKVQPVIASKVSLNSGQFALMVGTGIGFYDGLIGPGTGAFFSTAYLCFMGATLISATAHTKVLNATSNVSSLAIFSITGHIIWGLGLIMALGQWLGAQVGSRIVLSKGTTIIRPMVIFMCLAISAKLLYEQL